MFRALPVTAKPLCCLCLLVFYDPTAILMSRLLVEVTSVILRRAAWFITFVTVRFLARSNINMSYRTPPDIIIASDSRCRRLGSDGAFMMLMALLYIFKWVWHEPCECSSCSQIDYISLRQSVLESMTQSIRIWSPFNFTLWLFKARIDCVFL